MYGRISISRTSYRSGCILRSLETKRCGNIERKLKSKSETAALYPEGTGGSLLNFKSNFKC